ncbi:MAG: hypothetical protein HZC54_06205 [Verrucomicrobia bacterium]|nr:hypothetical protein [Verrucomicrobiota bacterium]
MKWIVFTAVLAATVVFAQTPSKKLEPYKKSKFEGRGFDTKTFTTKTFPTKEFETKRFETKEFPVQASPAVGERFDTHAFAPPEKKVSWWQRLFGTHKSDASGKGVPEKSFATKGFTAKAAQTKVDGKTQEKVDRVLDPKTLAMPNIKPTPEDLNKPVDSRPKSFPTATPVRR